MKKKKAATPEQQRVKAEQCVRIGRRIQQIIMALSRPCLREPSPADVGMIFMVAMDAQIAAELKFGYPSASEAVLAICEAIEQAMRYDGEVRRKILKDTMQYAARTVRSIRDGVYACGFGHLWESDDNERR